MILTRIGITSGSFLKSLDVLREHGKRHEKVNSPEGSGKNHEEVDFLKGWGKSFFAAVPSLRS